MARKTKKPPTPMFPPMNSYLKGNNNNDNNNNNTCSNGNNNNNYIKFIRRTDPITKKKQFKACNYKQQRKQCTYTKLHI